MTPEELEAGYFRAYDRFYTWSSILRRCRSSEPGFAQRLFLNAAYKRVEPLYGVLGRRFRVGWLRPLFNWYARPYRSPRGATAQDPSLADSFGGRAGRPRSGAGRAVTGVKARSSKG
jgi:hypothetical protein